MRQGFTLIEILIALLITTSVVSLAIQQTFAYFHLQTNLIARAELRGETKAAQDKVDQQLRYAIMLEEMPGSDGYVIVVPRDVDHCGRICYLDTYEMSWFRLRPNPTNTGTVLQQQTITLPAFRDEPDLPTLQKVYAYMATNDPTAKTRTVADAIDKLSITVEGGKFYHTQIFASQPAPANVHMGIQEMIAPRSLPMAMEGTPSFQDVVQALVKARKLKLT